MLTIDNISKNFGGVKALSGASCFIGKGEIVCLIGPNGAGKTTLFNVVTGFIEPDCGKVLFQEHDLFRQSPHHICQLGISRTFQNLRLIRRLTVLDNVLLAFGRQQGERLFNVLFRCRLSRAAEQQNMEQALHLLEQVDLIDKAHDASENLSYGQQKLLSLACCLATHADLLLLDEPIAGVSPLLIEKIMDLIQRLPEQGKSVVMIEHNLDAVASVCNRMIFMDAGRIVSEGTPESVRNDPQVIKAYIR